MAGQYTYVVGALVFRSFRRSDMHVMVSPPAGPTQATLEVHDEGFLYPSPNYS